MTETLTVDGCEVTVCEMTVKDQREWLKQRIQAGKDAAQDGAEFDLIGWHLFEEVSFGDVVFMTNLTAEALESMKPSAIQKVVDACKKANPHFFAMRERAGL